MANAKKFHIGIKAVIENNRKILVLEDPRFHGYDLPGGKIDEGENIEAALVRELKEELGLKKFKIGELLYVFERPDYLKQGVYLMLIFFKVKAKISKIVLDNEHTGFKWVSNKYFKTIVKDGLIRNEGVKQQYRRH